MPVTLVCFAVEEEARPFRRLVGDRSGLEILVTGMGRRNAERKIREGLSKAVPAAVLTCGFAGGLRPDLKTGDVLYETNAAGMPAAEPLGGSKDLVNRLERAGARRGRFTCADKVAVTAAAKALLFKSTGADAVEMESEAIHQVCRERGVPCATVRVILDTANEDLPLDFNALMTPDLQLAAAKLAKALVRRPGKIPALLRLQKQTRAAAKELASVLAITVRAFQAH